jgi:hypothetical protein
MKGQIMRKDQTKDQQEDTLAQTAETHTDAEPTPRISEREMEYWRIKYFKNVK